MGVYILTTLKIIMPKRGFTKKRANPEARYVSEYCLLKYPDDTIKLRVPLGTAPESIIKEMGLARTLRQFRPYRPEADALVIRSDSLVLIEGKIIKVLDGLSKLIVYRDLLKYTPELEPFKDFPITAILVTPKPPLWFLKVATDFDIAYDIYAPDWLTEYYNKQDTYFTKAERLERFKRSQALDKLGFGEGV